jgi:hypothetical protein
MRDTVALDPPLARDGTCATCGGRRSFKGLRPLYRAPAKDDPFCSTECARRWHGVPLLANQVRTSTAYVSKTEEVTPSDH